MRFYLGSVYWPKLNAENTSVSLFVFLKRNFVLFFSFFLILFSVLISYQIKKGEFLLYLNGLDHPFLDLLFKYGTNLGHSLVYLPLGVALWLIHKKYLPYMGLLFLIQTAFSLIFKKWLFKGDPRPKIYFGETFFNDLHQVTGVNQYEYNTFPSGHTTTAFAIVFFLLFFFRFNFLTQIGIILLAILVGLSRVYLLHHFYIDIAYGAMFGGLSAAIVFIVFSLRMKDKIKS